ncbi:MAG: SsrA-binding protein SmpB [Candidatus Omnitrophota bacterium]|nr:MAG: SsrA-binding protein SmpB [Candidatus Omnitrophota bacterium]
MKHNNIIATNRQALRDYFILETFEAGIELKGSEIKSIRKRRANLKESFARIGKGEVFLYNLHISPYEFARRDEIEPKRARKLLLKKKQINYLFGKISGKGLTLIPLKLYLKRGLAKVEIALAKGKRFYDKRETLKRKVAQREINRALRKKRH